MRIGLVVKRLREARRWSQGQLAMHSGVTGAGISLIEGGQVDNPRIGTLLALAGALGVSVSEILAEAGLEETPDDSPIAPEVLSLQRVLDSVPPEHQADARQALITLVHAAEQLIGVRMVGGSCG